MSNYNKGMMKRVSQKPKFQGHGEDNPTKVNSNSKGKTSGGFTHKAPALSTDLQCYFQCPETFKKDYDIRLHLKLRHKNEDPSELERARQAAEEEIAFVKRSGVRFQCAICNQFLNNDHAMYEHTQKAHNLQWMDYKDQYGRCEVESAPFECKICGGVVKYTPAIVHTHLKQVHGLNWVKYLDRIRKMARGEEPDALPEIEKFDCKICNASVKYLKDHIWEVHRITFVEYEDRLQKINQGIIPDALPCIDTFQCQVCNVTVKGLKDHLWNVHRLTESDYEERLRRMSQGEDPGELPSIETFECKICNVSVKLFREHLKHAHKIKMSEYQELFPE